MEAADDTPLPPKLQCQLTVKAGEPLTPCRDRAPGHEFSFMVADGYSVLEGHIKRIIGTIPNLAWSEPLAVYVKPTNNAPQKKYLPLSRDSTELRDQLATIWHKARLRKHGHAAFVLLLFVYVPRPRAQRLTSLRRATDARIQEQLPRVAAYMREHQVDDGAATQRYAAVAQARLPDDALTQVPDNETFRQLQFIDRQAAAVDRAAEDQRPEDEAYHLVRARMHGVIVPLFLNVSDLRAAIGLPPYSLRPPYRAPREFDTPEPAEDIEDVDHQDAQADRV